MPRRRYDTQSLVGDLKRERRHAVLLSILGLGILGFLAFYFVRLRGPDVPEVPSPVATPAATSAPRDDDAAPAPVPMPKASELKPTPLPRAPPPAPRPAEATLTVVLPRAGPLLVNGEVVAKKVKEHEIKLAPGRHRIATRLGRRTIELPVEVEAGKRYRVDLNPRRKKGAVEELPR